MAEVILENLEYADFVSERELMREKSLELERLAGKYMHANYPIGDFLIRIKNSARAGGKVVEVPTTKLIFAVAEVLKSEGFLSEVKKTDGKLELKLAYKSKQPVLMDLKLRSKPGLREYMDADKLEKFRGSSILIVSTSKGIMSSYKARKARVGGEVIAEIW